jgi:hypothetical protein
MICALTVRTVDPAKFDEFRRAFMGDMAENPPAKFVRFDMVRNVDKPDEVVCFGLFDGTAEELRAMSAGHGRDEQLEAIEPFVQAVGTDGLFEVVEEFTREPARSA